MSDSIQCYNYPTDYCSCRDEYGRLTHLGERYREFYELFKQGNKAVDCLNIMGLERMCCRLRFINMIVEPMIDRSERRYVDTRVHNNIISISTPKIKPGVNPPEFPLL